jgi:Holliday junction resolvase RusA-like endonuclease
MRVEVEGRPAPKGSRIYGRNKKGQTFTRPASKYEKPWVDAVKAATALQMRHHEPIAPPYKIDLQIFVAASPRAAKPWPSQHDVDKLARAIVDGLVFGGAIGDDRDVIELHAHKSYANGRPAGVIAEVTSAA